MERTAGRRPACALRATASTHDEWCSAGTSDPEIPCVVLFTSRSELREVSRAACSFASQTVCAPRRSSLGEGFVVLRRARVAEYSLCHHVCRIFHRHRRNESSDARLVGRPSTPRWRLSSLALRPLPPSANARGRVWRDLRGQHLDPLGSPPCSRGADESFRVLRVCSPRDEQGRKSSCCVDAGPHAPDGSPRACHPQSAVVAHRGSCWPVRLRRSPRDEAIACIPRRAPLVAEARGRLRHRALQAGHDAGVDLGSRWASPLELALRTPGHRRHGEKSEAGTMAPHLAVGLPSLPPDASRRVRFERPRGHSEERRSMTDEDPSPTAPAIARAAGQALQLRSPSRKTRKSPTTAHRAFTWMHPETRRSRTSAAYLLSIFKDVHPVWCRARDPILVGRSGEAPRHAALASLWFERALSRALIEPGPMALATSRGVLPADPPSPARAADRSETSIERAPGESRWDRLSRASGQREPLRRS